MLKLIGFFFFFFFFVIGLARNMFLENFKVRSPVVYKNTLLVLCNLRIKFQVFRVESKLCQILVFNHLKLVWLLVLDERNYYE